MKKTNSGLVWITLGGGLIVLGGTSVVKGIFNLFEEHPGLKKKTGEIIDKKLNSSNNKMLKG
jgi:hypothetical protein